MSTNGHQRPLTALQAVACGVLAVTDLWLAQRDLGAQLRRCSIPVVSAGASGQTEAPEMHAGMPAPAFTLLDSEGRLVSLLSLRGRRVLLSFMCGCQRCLQLAPALEKVHQFEGAPVVLVDLQGRIDG